MKKLTILLFIIIGFIGCGSNSSNNINSEQEMQTKVENIITKEIRYDFELLENQEDLNLFIDELNRVLILVNTMFWSITQNIMHQVR